jgi:hypothetical protein
MAKKNDPTVTSDVAESSVSPAPPVHEADDGAPIGTYKDNPDKPDPSTVAQVEEVPADKQRP